MSDETTNLSELPYPLQQMNENCSSSCHLCLIAVNSRSTSDDDDDDDEETTTTVVKKLMRCSRCKVAWYCSVDCQRKAYKNGHKFWCNKLIDGGGLAFLDKLYEFLGAGKAAASGIDPSSIVDGRLKNQDYRIAVAKEFWGNPARLIFPNFEKDPWAGDELPQAREDALIRSLDPIRLLQAVVASVCHDLKETIPDSQTATKLAFDFFAKYQNAIYGKNHDNLKYVAWLWITAVLWTVAMDRLLNKEKGDPEGERVARIRINRARALHMAQSVLSAADRNECGEIAHACFGFYWPIGEFEQPPLDKEKGNVKSQRGRWDLIIALVHASIGDARLAAKATNANPATRAMAYLVFARAGAMRTSWQDKMNLATRRAVALVQSGHDAKLSELQQQQTGKWKEAIRSEAEKIFRRADYDKMTEAANQMHFFACFEPYHIAKTDNMETMGGGYSKYDGLPLEEYFVFGCSQSDQCIICQEK